VEEETEGERAKAGGRREERLRLALAQLSLPR